MLGGCRLNEEAIDGYIAPAQGFILAECGHQQHRRRVAVSQLGAQAADRGDAVDAGHFQVDQAEQITLWWPIAHLRQRGLTRVCAVRFQPQLAQHGGKHATGDGVVVNHQHLASGMAAQVLDQHGEAAALAEFLHTKASREMEGAALAVFTFYPDAAAHQLNQMLADGQAKSGTAKAASR